MKDSRFSLVRCLASLLFTLILGSGSFSWAADGEATSPTVKVGRTVTDFSLPTHRGPEWSLKSVADSNLVVLVFLGTECPLAKLYAPRIAELQAEYEPRGVTFVGINSNTQDSVREITAYVNRHELGIPILKDVGNRIADQLGAQRTPEVFVLDPQRVIRYHGRIDDQYLVGFAREKPRRRDLAIALDELLAGEKVSVSSTEPIGCFIGRVSKTAPRGDITYSQHIARIFNNRCVECHRSGEIAPFTLTSYDDVLGWEDTILEVIESNRMPPWFANPNHGSFSNDSRLTDEEKSLIRKWVNNGMPEGDRTDLPEPPEFTEGWRIPAPDSIVHLAKQPVKIPAEGVIDYQYYTVDPHWKEDKYIYAAEARPGNPAVVHHIIVYVIPPGQTRRPLHERKMLVGYAPGATPKILTDGVAIYAPAGSKLLFEMHYTPNGRPQTDRSYAGFAFMDRADVKKQLQGRMAVKRRLTIPPNDPHYEVSSEYYSPRDELLLTMTPHMHLRGKAFRYHAYYPNGDDEVLLDVPRYDFNWQLSYELVEPKLLPKGTRIVCTAAYDNSEDNPVNPDPNKRVGWGDQSWQEMMIGFFSVVPADESNEPLISDASIDPSGTWTWKRSGKSERLTLKLKDNRLTGSIQASGREIPITKAQIQRDQLTFQISVKEFGDLLMDFQATVTERQLRGKISFTIESVGRTQRLPWVAERSEN